MVVIGLLVVLGGLALLSERVGLPAPRLETPANPSLLGGRGPIALRFQQDMERISVETLLSFEPAWSGEWSWQDDRTLVFNAATAQPPESLIKLIIQPGARSRDGRELRSQVELVMKVRPLEVVYVGSPLDAPELWRIGLDGSNATQITQSGGRVFDFAVSPDGEHIIYSRANLRDGSDLILIDRQGESERVLVECGMYACVEPNWTPDGEHIAYTRYASGLTASLNDGVGQIYSVNVESGRSALLFNNPGLVGFMPIFAPDGLSLSFYDLGQQAIRLVNLLDGSSSVIPSQVTGRGVWSPDGGQLLVVDVDGDSLIPTTTIFRLDLENRSVSRFFPDTFLVLDASLPDWSADGRWLVGGIQSESFQEGKQLWLFDAQGTPLYPITENPQYTHTGYRWAPAGGMVVMQRFNLGNSSQLPEILLWEMENNHLTILAQNGALPQWLP
ncbi:MAG: hypothetical protein AB1453_02465 [Chloroflexota bacterium]